VLRLGTYKIDFSDSENFESQLVVAEPYYIPVMYFYKGKESWIFYEKIAYKNFAIANKKASLP